MNIAELKLSIMNNSVPNFIIFTGEEFGIMDIYIKDICSNFCGTIHKPETVADALSLCRGKSILSKNKLIIVTDDNDFVKNEKAWPNIKNLIGTNKLILKYHNSDSRLSFWKNFSNDVVVFEKMSSNVLSKHLVNKFKISQDNALKIANYLDNDYTRCLLELDKVSYVSKIKNITMDDAITECIRTNVLCLDTNTNIFDFVDFLLHKNYSSAFNTYKKLIESGEPELKILNALYNSFKNVLIAQTMSSGKNIQQNAGISYYSYMKAKESSGYYTNDELENILYILMEIEQGIKTGKVPTEFSIDLFLINL